MDTNVFQFTYNYPVTLPCGGMYVSSYDVKASFHPVYKWSEDMNCHVFVDVRFELDEVWRTDQYPSFIVPAFGKHPEMVAFGEMLKNEARKVYERRSGSCNFETVTIHDQVQDVSVRVVETINLKAA